MSRARPLATRAARACAALLLSALAACRGDAEAGRRIFAGERPVTARLEGDDLLLPAAASRCANCHLPRRPPDAGAGVTQLFGPPLDEWRLEGLHPRRGGPPSRYDVDAFCTLLRTGRDPAGVLIARTMPRYELDPGACRDLWAFVTR